MGFITDIIKKAAITKAENYALNHVDRYLEKTRSPNAIINNSNYVYSLLIKQIRRYPAREYIVYDNAGVKRYTISRDIFRRRIRLYDISDYEIAHIYTRRLFFSRSIVRRYALYLDNDFLGNADWKFSFSLKLDINFRFNEWHMSGNLTQNTFYVYNANHEQVLQVDSAYSVKRAYVLHLDNKENEIIGLLAVMLIEESIHRK